MKGKAGDKAMTEEEFEKKHEAYNKLLTEDEGNTQALMDCALLLIARAEEINEGAEGFSKEALSLTKEAEDRLQEMLEIEETSIEAYELLTKIYFKRLDDAATPAERERLFLDAAIFELGVGACYIYKDDLKNARTHFEKSFSIMKNKQKIAVIPFTFILGIDFLERVRPDEQNRRASKQILPTGVLTGHEEVDMICNAITYAKPVTAVKPTMTARAAYRLSEMIIARPEVEGDKAP